jgi:Leucine-rich repeat (LRR) protein
MYLNSKSYEKKYRKYKNKYQILKIIIGGKQGTLLNGGDCFPLPNPEEYDIITAENLLNLDPDARITIQNKCYDVNGLYNWVITYNKNILPSTLTEITVEEKQRLTQAYDELLPNILTRDKLIQIYPNLQQETEIDLSYKGYTDIALGTFDNLPRLKFLYLNNNKIKELQPGLFNNLLGLQELLLNNNKIRELKLGTFNNLSKLHLLYLNNNQIQELQPGVFNNLLRLQELLLNNNKIRELKLDTFNNLPKLHELYLGINQIQELQPGVFNNLPNLRMLFLSGNQISRLQPNSYYGLYINVKII